MSNIEINWQIDEEILTFFVYDRNANWSMKSFLRISYTLRITQTSNLYLCCFLVQLFPQTRHVCTFSL